MPLIRDGPAQRRRAMLEIIRQANNDERQVSFLNTAPQDDGTPIRVTPPMDAAMAYSYVENLEAVPWEVDREEALVLLEDVDMSAYGATFWLSNGIQDIYGLDFALALNSIAPLQVYDNIHKPYLMMPPQTIRGEYHITVKRATIAPEEELWIKAYDQGQNLIGRQALEFGEQETQGNVTFTPGSYDANPEDFFRFVLDGYHGAGSTVLVSDNYKPRSVGIASYDADAEARSLLSEGRFISAALEPYTDIYFNNLKNLIESGKTSVIVIPDAFSISELVRPDVEQWVENGGTLIRFAGPFLTQEAHSNDPLLPVDLRKGVRNLDYGTLNTNEEEPPSLTIQTFDPDTPFGNLQPGQQIEITHQAIVDPSSDLDDKTWARLSDGTPFVTASEQGQGQVVMFHSPANTRWSDFTLTNTFVDMLVATVEQANSIENTAEYDLPELPPLYVMNGEGKLRTPSPAVQPLSQAILEEGALGPSHPPGLYGNDIMQVPLNLSDGVVDIEPLTGLPDSIEIKTYQSSEKEMNMQGWLWASALFLSLIGGALLTRRHTYKPADLTPSSGNQPLPEELSL